MMRAFAGAALALALHKPVPAAGPPPRVGELRTAVIIYTTPGQPQGTSASVDDVERFVFGAGAHGLADFVRDNSSGRAWLTGRIYGPYRVPPDLECDRVFERDYFDRLLAFVGRDAWNYPYHVIVTPCASRGLVAGFGGGSRAWVRGLGGTLLHEFGHALGLSHSFWLQCWTWTPGRRALRSIPILPAQVYPAIETGDARIECRRVNYGDPYSTMGWGGRVLNAVERDRLGWMDGLAADVRGDGLYELAPLTAPGPGMRALRIPFLAAGGGPCTRLTVEFRQRVGIDSLSIPDDPRQLGSGVFVRLSDPDVSWSGVVLSMKPALGGPRGMPMQAGKQYRVGDVELSLQRVEAGRRAVVAVARSH
jgi:hypothetical protein